MSYELAKGVTDVDIALDPCAFILKNTDPAPLYDFLNKLELKKIIERLKLSPSPAQGTQSAFAPPKMHIVSALPKLSFPAIYPDFSILQMGVCDKNGCYVCPITAQNLEKIFDGEYSVHDGKAFLKAACKITENPKTPDFDTSLAAYLLNPTAYEYSLATCASLIFGYTLPPLPESQMSLMNDSDEESMSALALRASLIFALTEHYMPALREQNMLDLLKNIELPLLPVLASMEVQGIKLDTARLNAFGAQLDVQIAGLEKEIIALAGQDFNIGSPKQLSVILFETLGLKPLKKTKSGYSTDNDVLEKLQDSHPIIEKIIAYRRLSKLKSTYVDGLIKVVAPDGRIHTTFNQTVTATGRLSSTEPNLQNIPIRRDMGAEIRKCFVPKEGCIFID
ncbi:MAG: DNA polymerase, partial [Oscillospiraceae bacterium]